MYEAWNRGDVAGFFAEDALFAELEGTIYRSRSGVIAAHEEILGTVMKGSQLVRGEVAFARIVSPGVGVLHSRVGILMPGEEEPPPTRFSMQLFVTVWRNDRWAVVALENARLLSLETMAARISSVVRRGASRLTCPRDAGNAGMTQPGRSSAVAGDVRPVATPGTPSRRTGRKPKYIQYEGFRPARREHAPDAAP
ncbi:SgcJ/EcaC family oxidoreductase [Streptomyces sp. ALI-76-A]|uniref:SgcJ/EcaC family oxidoreductase n=1 Tax=Streptomyces sp. ALI-76-A TaxID=3025736 RepID=UPI00256F0AFB|nr:SgcJ/EcaC family oxidoreductase [Streptomyces sp. ALI-76-A]MDL5206085.1 SgcJ/EcaC family oxidoreductase [Streptomyces sp. ALI-76-A]